MKTFILKSKTDPDNNISFYPVVVVSDDKIDDLKFTYDLEVFAFPEDESSNTAIGRLKAEIEVMKSQIAALKGRKP